MTAEPEQKFAFICGAPRSGTTLLTNLLDGHPDIYMLPEETRLLQLWNLHKTNNSLERFFLRDYLNTLDVLYYTSDVLQEQHSGYLLERYGVKNYFGVKVDRNEFAERYRRVIDREGISLKSLYYAMFEAVMRGGGERKLLIDKRSLDNEMAAIMLNKTFPEAKFIHVIRDPRTRYLSSKMRRVYRRFRGITPKYADRQNGKDFATAHAEVTMTSMELARLNKAILGEKYHIVLHEDMLENPDREMRKIAAHLGVGFTENLLAQTSSGRERMAVSSIDKGMSSGIKDITEKRLKSFFQNTSTLERKILYLFTWEIAQYFKYDIEPVECLRRWNFIRLLKYENPKDYLSDRAYMWKHLVGSSSLLTEAHFHVLLNRFDRGIIIQD